MLFISRCLVFLVWCGLPSGIYLMLFFVMISELPFILSIIAGDTDSKWSNYCRTMPVSKISYISAKYISNTIISIMTGLLWSVFALFTSYPLENLILLSVIINCGIGMITHAFVCPLVLKLGTTSYTSLIFISATYLCIYPAIPLILSSLMPTSDTQYNISLYTILLTLAVILIVYLLSWLVSVVIYNNFERS